MSPSGAAAQGARPGASGSADGGPDATPRTPQRRGAALAQTVLEATARLLAEKGYEFAVDDVATLAGVHKTTIYRRWETKPALVAAAIAQIADREVGVATSGEPLLDLERLTVQVAAALRLPAGLNALRAALSTAGADPELRETAAAFLAARYRVATTLIRAAQDDGSVRPDLDPRLVWQAVVNPLHMNALTGDPVDDRTARALLDLVLRGASTGSPAGD